MAEINDKPSLKTNSLSSLVKQIEGDLTKYIDSGQNLAEKSKRKKSVMSALENLAIRIQYAGKCPEGTVWDPVSRTCKPAS